MHVGSSRSNPAVAGHGSTEDVHDIPNHIFVSGWNARLPVGPQ